MVNLQNDWDELLRDEFQKDYYLKLRDFLKREYRQKTIFPHMNDIFNAFRLTPYSEVKAVIVGQDPYINPGEAHGLAFSVQPTAPVPPSLTNIFIELRDDLQCSIPNNGCLTHWAMQGVMLLNTVLTVERGKSKSHSGQGWERFTSAALDMLNRKDTPVVFLLWGKDAQSKIQLIHNNMHHVLYAAHPSPLAGGRFFGCRHFSQANEFLIKSGQTPIDWQIPDV